LALLAGDLQVAHERLVEAARAFKAFEMWDELLDSLEDLSELSARNGALEITVRAYAAASEARSRLHLARSPRQEQRCAEQMERLRQTVEAGRFDAQWLIGTGWDVGDALSALEDPVSQTATLLASTSATAAFERIQS
jgi:hypothetical protein